MGIEHGILESYNSDFELQFSHPLKHIVGMCRIIHKPLAKSIGNGFLQLKSSTGHASVSSTGASALSGGSKNSSSSLAGNGLRHTLTASTSYGSLSSSAASAYQQQPLAAEVTVEQPQNFMEFQGPITGLVYLLKDPKDPLLHIYLFECEAVEEVSFQFPSPKKKTDGKSCRQFWPTLCLSADISFCHNLCPFQGEKGTIQAQTSEFVCVCADSLWPFEMLSYGNV